MTLRRALPVPSSANIELTATANSITVDWMAVALQAGASTYALSITSTDDNTIIAPVDIDAMTRAYTFTNLMPNTEYAVTVIVKGNERYIASQSFIVKGATEKLPGLRLRLRVFLEGPLQ
ncbi:MAG: fibronectin type III domain-containing protein, partial [Candidatus Oxydemutatoraceae bacterium WSBS_2016_MAG_OTU14]